MNNLSEAIKLEEEVHAQAREDSARKIFKLMRHERPDVAITFILNEIDHWYGIGFVHGQDAITLK